MPNSEKLVVDLVRQYPREVTVVCMGPATVVARALDLCPDLSAQVKRLVVLGGTLSEPGNAGPVNEFNFFCDPPAVRQVLQAHFSLTMIPLDVMRQVVLAPADLLALPDETKPGAFLKQIAPFGIAANSNLHGVEGFYLQDVLGVVAVALPGALRLKAMAVDIETRGELTRGMSVFDQRPSAAAHTNVDLAIEVNPRMVRDYIGRVLKARFDS